MSRQPIKQNTHPMCQTAHLLTHFIHHPMAMFASGINTYLNTKLNTSLNTNLKINAVIKTILQDPPRDTPWRLPC